MEDAPSTQIYHCVKSVQNRKFSWSLFSCIRIEYRNLLLKSPYSVRIQEKKFQKNQKKFSIWTLFHAVFVSKIQNRVTFKVKFGYYLELLTSGTTKLLGSTEQTITTEKNSENVARLVITEVILVHCSIVNNRYMCDWRVLPTFVLNKCFGQLLAISPKNHIYWDIFCSKFSYNEVWFTDQSFVPLEKEDRINLTLLINNGGLWWYIKLSAKMKSNSKAMEVIFILCKKYDKTPGQ